jgi:hypothetical protein
VGGAYCARPYAVLYSKGRFLVSMYASGKALRANLRIAKSIWWFYAKAKSIDYSVAKGWYGSPEVTCKNNLFMARNKF